MKTRSAMVLVLMLAGAVGRVAAQGGNGNGAGADDLDDFPLLKKYEEKKRLLKQQEFEKRRRAELSRVRHQVQLAIRESDPDARVSGLLGAYGDIQKMLREKSEARLEVVARDIWDKVLGVPPPQTFRSPVGLEMELVKAGDIPFYATSGPITAGDFRAVIEAAGDRAAPPELADAVRRLKSSRAPSDVVITGLSWRAANALATWVADLAGADAALPSLQQAKDMGRKLPQAVWSATEWSGGTVQEKRDQERFGVHMYCIWDPGTKLGGDDVVAELPFASFPVVAVYLVTEVKTGVEARLTRLSASPVARADTPTEN